MEHEHYNKGHAYRGDIKSSFKGKQLFRTQPFCIILYACFKKELTQKSGENGLLGQPLFVFLRLV